MAFQLTSAEAMARGLVDCAHSSVSVSLDGRPSKRPSRGPPAPSGHSFNGISAIPAEVWEVIFEHCAANDPPEVGEGHKKEGWGAIRRACRRFRWIVDNDPHIPALTCTQLPSIVDRVEVRRNVYNSDAGKPNLHPQGRIGEVPCSYILSPQIPRLRFARHINSDSDKARCSLLLNSSLVTKASTVVLEGRGDIAGHLRKLYSMAGGPRKLRELKVSLAKGASSVVRQVPPIHISRHVNDGRNRELSELGQGLGLHAEGLRELVLGTCLLKTAFTPNLTLLVLSWNSKLCVPRPTMREIKDAILSHCALSIEILVLENCPQFMTFTESSGGALELPRLRKLEITRTTSIVTTQVLSGIRFPAETRLKFAVEVTGSSNLQCVMGSIIMLLEGIGEISCHPPHHWMLYIR